MTVEELDLAPMVDVAFQLVLFFMVAAQTVLYKTLEIPKPTTDQAPAAVTQGRSRTLDDLKDDYILVEIDSSGAMKLDRQPIAADMTTLVERLRSAREATRRKAMLLSADFATPHRSAVLAYDAANEIGLGIVIARPASPQGPRCACFQVGPPRRRPLPNRPPRPTRHLLLVPFPIDSPAHPMRLAVTGRRQAVRICSGQRAIIGKVIGTMGISGHGSFVCGVGSHPSNSSWRSG